MKLKLEICLAAFLLLVFSGGAFAQVSITTSSPLPQAIIGTAYSTQLAATGGTAPFTWALTTSPSSLPAGLSLTTSGPLAGTLSGTPTSAGTFSFTVRATASGGTSATKTFSLTVNLNITTTTLPAGNALVPYSTQLAVNGGDTPYRWRITTGSLPSGLALSNSGVISGIPLVAGESNFTVEVEDDSNPRLIDSQALTLIVGIQPTIEITTSSLPNGTIGIAYSNQLAASGGTAPYTWSRTAGSLPAGVTLSGAGLISGTPTSTGSFTFTVEARDSRTPPLTGSRQFTLRIPPVITTQSLPNTVPGAPYSVALTASPSVSTPLVWTITQGSLPPELTLSSSGVISGEATAAGSYSFTVTVTDASGLSGSRAFTISVGQALTITTASPLPVAVVGQAYSRILEATGASPLTWSVSARNPPAGISLNSNGTLSGTPSASGIFDFTVQATGGSPTQTTTKEFRLVVNGALQITTAVELPPAIVGASYSVSLAAAGGVPPYSWSNPGIAVPQGMTLSTGGVLSGTPTVPGTFTFIAQVTDSFSPTLQASRTFSLTVAAGTAILTTSVPNAIRNVPYSFQLQGAGTGSLTWRVSTGSLPNGISLSTGGLLSGTPSALSSSTFTVTLTDSRGVQATRSFTLVVDPSLPTLSIPGLPSTLSTRQALPIGLNLATPRSSALSGQLRLTFTSTAEVSGDDPMTMFSNGTRTVAFTIAANSTVAAFPNPVLLLTGTVAGNVRVTASFDSGPADVPVAAVDIPAVAPQVTAITATRATGGFNVQITGYSPARRVSTVDFSFEVRVGTGTTQMTLTRNVDTDFGGWFQNPASVPFGSSFSYLQSFVVEGDTSAIVSVSVRMTNAQGATTSATVPLN